jgi:hypothetical protein
MLRPYLLIIFLINIYAPAQPAARQLFFKNLLQLPLFQSILLNEPTPL